MPESNILWRIDDRLIHGQIIIGWCSQLPIAELIVCDDEIAETEWETNLLLMAAPPEIPSSVLSISDTISRVREIVIQEIMVLILMKSPFTLQKILKRGTKIEKVNIGGIHFREDRSEFLSYLYLSEKEIKIFEELMGEGIRFECQDLPNSPVYNLEKLLEKKK
ncbi:MAG: PTS sugar transporter subunit IIB [Calditrichia bacterium]